MREYLFSQGTSRVNGVRSAGNAFVWRPIPDQALSESSAAPAIQGNETSLVGNATAHGSVASLDQTHLEQLTMRAGAHATFVG